MRRVEAEAERRGVEGGEDPAKHLRRIAEIAPPTEPRLQCDTDAEPIRRRDDRAPRGNETVEILRQRDRWVNIVEHAEADRDALSRCLLEVLDQRVNRAIPDGAIRRENLVRGRRGYRWHAGPQTSGTCDMPTVRQHLMRVHEGEAVLLRPRAQFGIGDLTQITRDDESEMHAVSPFYA